MKKRAERKQASYTKKVDTISIFGIDASVCFDWGVVNDNSYTEKNFLRENRNSKKYRYLFTTATNVSQYAIMAKSVEVERPIIYAIIDEVKRNESSSESFIFYKKISEDEIWYFQSSKEGIILSGDIILSMDDFLDILDEHILVSDYPDDMLYVYTDNSDEIMDISDVIKYKVINIEMDDLNSLEFKIIKVTGLLGIPFGYYLFFVFILMLYFLYNYIDSEIKIPDYPVTHSFKKVTELEEPVEWKVLSSATDKSFSDEVFLDKFLGVISMIPVSVNGWDVKNIGYEGDKIVILYKMSIDGKSTITKIRPLIKKHMVDEGMDSKDIGFDYYAVDEVLKVIIWIKKKDSVAGYKNIKEYKGARGYNDYMIGIKELKQQKKEYQKENQILSSLVNQTRGLSYFTRLYYWLNGKWDSDREIQDISTSKLATMYANYRKIYKSLPRLKAPEEEVMRKYSIRVKNIMSVYNYDQEISAIEFSPSTSAFKNGSRKSTFKMSGIGLNLLREKVMANKGIEPLRYKKANYNWKNSNWQVEGVLYEVE